MKNQEIVLAVSRVQRKNQITIKEPVLPFLPVKEGTEIEFVLQGTTIILRIHKEEK